MTRGEIKKLCKTICKEDVNTISGDSPIAWDVFIDTALDELTNATGACWFVFSADINTGVNTYPCVPLYRVRRVTIHAPNNVNYNAQITKRQWINAQIAGWENRNVVGNPVAVAFDGLNDMVLYPTPNFTATDGIEIEGWGYPTQDAWPNDTDECPIASTHQLTLVYGAILHRATMFPIDNQQLQSIQQHYTRGRGRMERNAATMTRANEIRGGEGEFGPMSNPWYPG